MTCRLDHIAFGVSSLDAGTRWLEDQLGVPLAPGGEHAAMGTHNRLLRLGAASYLELIAIDPAAEKPNRPRWFALDEIPPSDLATPRLLAWAASTDDISKTASVADYNPGRVHTMSRNSLQWLITIPDDGHLVEEGILPCLIEWPQGSHPAKLLPDAGVALQELQLCSPEPRRVQGSLASIGLDLAANRIRVIEDQGGPRMRLCLSTERGTVFFDSRPSTDDRAHAA